MNAFVNRQAELADFMGFFQKKLKKSIILIKFTNFFENNDNFT